MAKPSKAGAIFLFLFGLPFFSFGAFAAWAFLTSSPSIHGKNDHPLLGAIFCSVFALIGATLMFAAVYGYHKLQREAETQEANPDSPWLWRADWAASRADSRHRNTFVGWWIGTVLLGMIALPVTVSGLPPLLRDSDPKALLLLGFCLFPAILLIGASRATVRRTRYGTTHFAFGTLPFSLGSSLKGQIELRLPNLPEHGVDLRLSCVRHLVTGSGDHQSTSEIVLWQETRNVPQGGVFSGPTGAAIPVDFSIPGDAFETNHDNQRDQVLWMLHAEADVPGVNFSDDFEVPVFHASASSMAAAAGANFGTDRMFGASVASWETPGAASAFLSDPSDVPAPKNPRVSVSVVDGATVFYFPPFRNRTQTLLLFLFTAVWTGIVYFLWQSTAPWFFPAVFGFFDLLMIYGCVQSAFGSTRIVVGNGKIISRRAILGPGTIREIPFSDVKAILAVLGMQQGTKGNRGNYLVRAQKKSGDTVTLVENITDRQEARWIVAQIEKLVGLKLDTHIDLGDAFGRSYGLPPQRTLR